MISLAIFFTAELMLQDLVSTVFSLERKGILKQAEVRLKVNPEQHRGPEMIGWAT